VAAQRPHYTSVMLEFDVTAGKAMYLLRLFDENTRRWVIHEQWGPTETFFDQTLCEVQTRLEATCRGVAALNGLQLELLFD